MFTAAAAFLAVWTAISGYTCTITVHEIKGSVIQDRTYRYAYLKPHYAKFEIVAGPGRGNGEVWTGGLTVTGRQGGFVGFFSNFFNVFRHRVSMYDPGAVDLRGETIVGASFADVADELDNAPSVASDEATIDGVVTDAVTFPYTDDAGATRRIVYLSRVTHLPVRRVTYAGDTIVETEDFQNVDTAAKLSPAAFRG